MPQMASHSSFRILPAPFLSPLQGWELAKRLEWTRFGVAGACVYIQPSDLSFPRRLRRLQLPRQPVGASPLSSGLGFCWVLLAISLMMHRLRLVKEVQLCSSCASACFLLLLHRCCWAASDGHRCYSLVCPNPATSALQPASLRVPDCVCRCHWAGGSCRLTLLG
jgi:hypothetical protein